MVTRNDGLRGTTMGCAGGYAGGYAGGFAGAVVSTVSKVSKWLNAFKLEYKIVENS